jgi:hypothetical protein
MLEDMWQFDTTTEMNWPSSWKESEIGTPNIDTDITVYEALMA